MKRKIGYLSLVFLCMTITSEGEGEGTGEVPGEVAPGVVLLKRREGTTCMRMSKERERKLAGERFDFLKRVCSELANSRMILMNRRKRMIARMRTKTALRAITNAEVAIASVLKGKLPAPG
jgi:hypothetical protein